MLRGSLLAIVLLNAGHSFGAEKIWFLHGRVVDQEGQPVAGASVATVWNSNGVTLEHLRKFENDGKPHPEYATNEGRLEPWGEAPARTDANGNFSIELRSSNECKLMVVDKEQQRGGLVFFDPRNPPARVGCASSCRSSACMVESAWRRPASPNATSASWSASPTAKTFR